MGDDADQHRLNAVASAADRVELLHKVLGEKPASTDSMVIAAAILLASLVIAQAIGTRTTS